MEAAIVGGSILIGSFIIYKGIGKMADMMLYGIVRHALVSNFSRFGRLDNTNIAVIDDTRAYFVREGALWVANFQNDDLVMESARPIDLVGVDIELLKEAMIAVDVLSGNIEEDEEDDEHGEHV
jgi:hypothetical protein